MAILSGDLDAIVEALVREKVITQISNKVHRKYRISDEFCLNPSFRILILPSTGRTSGHAPFNAIKKIQNLLKPGVLEKVMGWPNPRFTSATITPQDEAPSEQKLPKVAWGGGWYPVTEVSNVLYENNDKESEDLATQTAVAVNQVESEPVMEKASPITITQPVAVASELAVPQPPVVKDDTPLIIPEKVAESGPLATMFNGYRDQALKIQSQTEDFDADIKRHRETIRSMEEIIEGVEARKAESSKQLKQVLVLLEQLSYSLMAEMDISDKLRIKPLDPVVVTKKEPVEPPVKKVFCIEAPKAITERTPKPLPSIHGGLSSILNALFAANHNRTFTSEAVVSELKTQGFQVPESWFLSNCYSKLIDAGYTLNFHRVGRGLYQHQ